MAPWKPFARRPIRSSRAQGAKAAGARPKEITKATAGDMAGREEARDSAAKAARDMKGKEKRTRHVASGHYGMC